MSEGNGLSGEFVNIQNPTIKSLNDYGFEEAGLNRADSTIFAQHLKSVFSGALLDKKHYHPLSDSEKSLISQKIDGVKGDIESCERSISSSEANIDKMNERLNTLKERREQLRLGELDEEGVSDVISVFNPIKFAITTFFLLMLSIFIFLFYVAVVYKAFFINTQDIANALIDGNWGVSLLPEWYEIYEALTSNVLVIFAPFVFYGFGYAIHVLLEQKSRFKILWIGLVIIVTFILDYLLAFQIHNGVNKALDLIGADPNEAFTDILLVLIMGFVVYIIWSVIFHYWMEELEKRNPLIRLGSAIKDLKGELGEEENSIRAKRLEIEHLRERLQHLSRSLENKAIPISIITNSIYEFATGWFRYINGINGDDKEVRKSECLEALDEYNRYEAVVKLRRKL